MDTPTNRAKSVCVVIVNYNSGTALTECVRSLLASTVATRIVVSDNDSTDDSIAILRDSVMDAAQVTVVKNGKNLGFAKANNVVLAHCNSDYVLVLNPDCIVEPDTLETMIGVMEQHPEAGMASCLVVNPDGSEQAGCRRSVPTPWRSAVRMLHLHEMMEGHPRFQSFVLAGLPLPDAPAPVEAISGAFMFVRRKALEAVGLMDEGYFLHCEDLDWCMRFWRAGWKILFVPQARVMHIKGVSTRAHPVFCEYHKHRGMLRYYDKFFRRQYPSPLMGVATVAVWSHFLAKSVWIMAQKRFSARQSTLDAPPSPARKTNVARDAKIIAVVVSSLCLALIPVVD